MRVESDETLRTRYRRYRARRFALEKDLTDRLRRLVRALEGEKRALVKLKKRVRYREECPTCGRAI